MWLVYICAVYASAYAMFTVSLSGGATFDAMPFVRAGVYAGLCATVAVAILLRVVSPRCLLPDYSLLRLPGQWLALNLFGVVVIFATGDANLYTVTDLGYAGLWAIIAGFVLVSPSDRLRASDRDIDALVVFIVACNVTSAMIGDGAALPVAVLALTLTVCRVYTGRPSALLLAASAIGLIAIPEHLNKAFFICSAVITLYAGFAASLRAGLITIFLWATFLLAFLTHTETIAGFFAGSQLERRVYEMAFMLSGDGLGESVSSAHRVYETDRVLEELNDRGPIAWLFGYGTGATLDMRDAPDFGIRIRQLQAGREIHNIHLLPYAVLYRYGLLGSVIWLAFLLQILSDAFSRTLRPPPTQLKGFEAIELFPSVFLLGTLACYGFASGDFFTDPLIPVAATLLWRHTHERRLYQEERIPSSPPPSVAIRPH